MGGPGVDQSRDEFNRYRDITPAVGGDRLVETLLSGLGLQSVLRNLCGIPMTLGWYCAFTPIKPVTISKEQSVFVADVWSRSRNATRNKRTIIRPFQCVIGDSISEQLIGLQTLRMSRDNLCSKPTMCRGLLISSAYISYVGKHACELGLISGTPNGYQLKVEIPALLKFHPHLEVKGIPSDVLSDPGLYPVYNPHHVIYGLSALIGGAILTAVSGVLCVRQRCAVRPFKTTVKPPTSDSSLRRSDNDPGARTPKAKWSANDDNVTFSF